MKTIEIPAPVALPKKVAMVRNYRCKPPAWELALVLDAKYSPAYRATNCRGESYEVAERWSYSVWIDRPFVEDKYGRQRGGGYRIEVGDDAIRRDE